MWTIVERVSRIFCYVSMGLVLVLMLLTTADVIGRYFLDAPVRGALEVSRFIMVGAVFLGLAYTATQKGHINVDVLVTRFSPRLRVILNAFGTLIGIVVFSLIGWQGIDQVKYAIEVGYVSDALHFPVYPARLVVPIGAFALCFVLFVQLSGYIRQIRKPEPGAEEPADQWIQS